MLEHLRRRAEEARRALSRTWREGGFLRRLHEAGPPLARVAAFAEAVVGATDPAQRPFYLPEFPGLSTRPWHDAATYAWAAPLLEAAPSIARDLARILDEGRGFLRYFQTPRGATWDLFPLWYMGVRLDRFASHCPDTARLLAALPDVACEHAWADVTFSRLSPGAYLPRHHSADNLRVRCHLPLVVPSAGEARAWISVGGERRCWEEGRLLAFDDSYEHEVHNPTAAARVVLIVDFWHPQLTFLERRALVSGLGRASIREMLGGLRATVDDEMRAAFRAADTDRLRAGLWDC